MGTDNLDQSGLTNYQIEQLSEHLKRLGDSVRDESKALAKLTAEVRAKDLLLDYRLSSIELAEKKSADSRRGLWMAIVTSLSISAVEVFIKK